MNHTLARVLAEFTFGVRGDALPQEAASAARMCVLDWLGSALAGSVTEPGRMIRNVTQMLGDGGPATLIPEGRLVPVTSAAFHNGAVSHIVELDDLHRASILHPGAAVIPAALATAELVRASGPDFLAAVVAGYEVAIRVGEAVTPSHYRYWHTTGTCGTFGAAAASARLLGLDVGGIASALGSAGTQAAGLWEFLADGAMSKHLHPGKAAMNGVLSALLAREGFTAASRILEGEKGFFHAMASSYDESRVTEGLGNSYRIAGMSFKVHASCRHTHSAIDTALDLLQRHRPSPADITAVHVETYQVALDITSNSQPDSVYSAKFSLPFCVALALCRGKAGLAEFTEGTLHDPLVRKVMGQVFLVAAPDLDAVHPAQWPARVTIRMRDGRTFTAQTDYPRGDPENPVTVSDLERKFSDLASPVVGQLISRHLVTTVSALDTLPHVGEMTACLRKL
ncbi:MAG: MmgE/PrpD family protein [Chloroflexota bacterium]|nr:MmgE/PrpD family protein [Chloroflexota bacterium]